MSTLPLSQQIRDSRIAKDLSQEELATMIGCSKRSLQGWEAGRTPQFRYRRAITRFLEQHDTEEAA